MPMTTFPSLDMMLSVMSTHRCELVSMVPADDPFEMTLAYVCITCGCGWNIPIKSLRVYPPSKGLDQFRTKGVRGVLGTAISNHANAMFKDSSPWRRRVPLFPGGLGVPAGSNLMSVFLRVAAALDLDIE